MSNNVMVANEVSDRLASGCDHLIRALDSGELQGAAYTAGRGLFSNIIIPSIQKLQEAIDDIQTELGAYQAADSVISGFGTLDRDQLEQLKKLREKQLRVIQDQIKENEDFFKQLGSLFSGNLVTLWRQTKALEDAEYQISQGITDIQDKLDKLDWFVAEVSQYFTDSLQVLQLAIQGATQLSQVIVDSGGNYYTGSLDMTWVTKMRNGEIDTHTSAKYRSPSNKLINKSIKEMRLSKAGEVYYRKRVSSLLRGHPSSDWQAIIKYYNNSLLIDDKGNIVFVTKVQHTKATVYVVLKNGEVDKDYTTQLNQDVNSQFWQSLGDNAMELLAGIGSLLGGSTLGIFSAGLGAGGLALALPSGGSITIPAEAVAATGFATSGTMIAGGTVALSDAFGKIATANSSMDISFAKSYEERAKDSLEKGVKEDKDLSELPKNVQEAYNGYDSVGWKGNYRGQTSGTNAGKIFRNREGHLPKTDTQGNDITYKEYDINSKVEGMNRDSQRFVRGSDGSVYYSEKHYETFIKVK